MAEIAPQYFPASESALYATNSVPGQLRLSKAAWFREYEGLETSQSVAWFTALSLDWRNMAI
jgi:hypothetical protein